MVVMVVVVLRLRNCYHYFLSGGELVAGELVEDGVATGELISGCRCYCAYFCRGSGKCRGGGLWW